MAGIDHTPAWAKGEGPPPPDPLDTEAIKALINKLLFLPQHEVHMLVKEEEWEQLDLSLLMDASFLSKHDLAVACQNRGLDQDGSRYKLQTRVTESLMEQRGREAIERHQEQERRWVRMKSLGGCFTVGKGTRGGLATGHRFHSSKALHVRGRANDRIMRVYTGFDSNVVFALTRTEDLFVWGASNGPTGLPSGQKNTPIFVKPEDRYAYDAPEEESDGEDGDDMLLPYKLDRMSKEHLVDISVGRRHCLALTYHGDLFGWGYHNHKQLGFLVPQVSRCSALVSNQRSWPVA